MQWSLTLKATLIGINYSLRLRTRVIPAIVCRYNGPVDKLVHALIAGKIYVPKLPPINSYICRPSAQTATNHITSTICIVFYIATVYRVCVSDIPVLKVNSA